MRGLTMAAAVHTAAALSSVSWLKAPSSTQLGLLPFPLEDLMFPGEQRDVFLFEDRFVECVERDHLVGGLLIDDSGAAANIAMLLKVEDTRADSLCAWARLTCIGRCELSRVRRSAAGYHVASAALHTDSNTDTDALEVAEEDVRRVHASTAAQRRELLKLLSAEVEERDADPVAAGLIHIGPDKTLSPFGAYVTELDEELAFEREEDDEYEDELLAAESIFVGQAWERPQRFGTCFYHCRDRGELDDEESGLELDELLATRRQALWQGTTRAEGERSGTESTAPDTAPSDPAGAAAGASAAAADSARASLGLTNERAQASRLLTSVLGEVWDERDEARAQRTLLSFAAAATLGPLERAEALLMTDANRRIQFALDRLSEQQQTLASMLVLVKKEAARSGRL